MKINSSKNTELYKIIVIGILLTICLLTTYYFHFVLKVEVLFTHLFYVPIILSSLWWTRKGILVAVFLALLLLVSHIISHLETPTYIDIIRAIMFILVAFVVSILSKKKQTLEDKLLAYSKTLEQKVEKRTSELKKSLREKELLLREIHHRVKNNMQVISSILDMSSMRTNDQNAINLFTDAKARIHTMALIHSQIYRSEIFDKIDMESHVNELVGYLSSAYADKKMIMTAVNISDIYLSIIQAIPCVLILNELISNSFKHAFKENQKGTIEVLMQKYDDNTIILKVQDNGSQIPDDIDPYNTNSLGLKLVRNLVTQQLKGEIEVQRSKGAKFIIKFKITNNETKHV